MADVPTEGTEGKVLVVTGPVWKPEWDKRIAEFAEKTKKTVEAIEVALADVVGEPSEDALATLADTTFAPDAEIKAALASLKIPSALFNKNLAILRGPKPEKEQEGEFTKIIGADLLPQVPDDDSFIAALKISGELRGGITPLDVQAVCKATIADGVALFDLPDKLLARMEEVALRTKKPYTSTYYELESLIAKRSYAEVLRAINVDSRYVGQKKKDDFLRLAKSILWPSMRDFHVQLGAWREAYRDLANDPRALVAAFKGRDIAEIPDTGPVRDAAEGFIDSMNTIFTGPGIPVCRAVGFDATNIKKLLRDERLPQAVGAADYEEMIETMGASVTADIVRQELNIVKFALAIMNLKNITPGATEADYILAMWQVGNTIPFDKLIGGLGVAKLGGPKKTFEKF